MTDGFVPFLTVTRQSLHVIVITHVSDARKANVDSGGITYVTLTAFRPFVILPSMSPSAEKPYKHRPPRIRVPHQQKAIFTVDNQNFLGVLQRLSLTGGTALLVKGPIPEGTLGQIVFGTVFGKVNAQVKFLYGGVDGVPTAQAFAFLAMSARSSQRIKRALEEMHTPGASDLAGGQTRIKAAFATLRQSVHQLSGMLDSMRRARSKG